jgi:DNA repair photolyase
MELKPKQDFFNLKLTSQFYFCPYAFSLDLYRGCPHSCVYCFAQGQYYTNESLKEKAFGSVDAGVDLEQLERFLSGKKAESIGPSTQLLNEMFKLRQPLHIGGMFDPFPKNIEARLENGKKTLELLNRFNYPAIISTKNPPVQYAELFRKGKYILQVSLISIKDDIAHRIERGAPLPSERLLAMKVLKGSVQKLVVRLQPFIPYLFEQGEIERYLYAIKEAGADAVTVEFLKVSKMKTQSIINQFRVLSDIVGRDVLRDLKTGGAGKKQDHEYSVEYKLRIMRDIKKKAHERGLEFYSAENDLRSMSDGPACCGLNGKEDPAFESKLHCFNKVLFLAKERGEARWSDLGDDDYMNIKGVQHMWNTQTRKQVLIRNAFSLRTYMERAWKTKTEMNPSIFFKGLHPARDEKTGELYYKYEEYE